ncbi:hypothetical protein N7532_009883 [Penicillium argentinense]|uniref:C2H2 finger domain protein n=1 Tax=Penicillium argentinense TaxID=1131581 RepID=A0A9W9JXY2_9EURO|nr:uncharacterized protein N7532_009883 [Penicillium argentinense]KAJ5085112.1 hypothetical protein N7532_009883 [Penicillium argentinense]
MESYPQYTEIPHIMPMTGVSTPSYDAYEPSLPADHPFVTRAAQFQFHLSPMEEQMKTREQALVPQPWWKADEQTFGMGYVPPDLTCADRFPPWNSGISSISDPQSPQSSNSGSVLATSCIAFPPFGQDQIAINVIDDQTGYPTPSGLVEIDPSMMAKPRTFEIQPDPRSPHEPDFDSWSGSQSDRNVTPEQQWPSPVPSDSLGISTSTRRSKAQSTSTSRVRKSSSKRPSSIQGRKRRRRGASSSGNGEENTPRTFVCSFARYGCESTFVSKNEWKRHVTSQHLQLGFYRCDVGKCSVHMHASPNRFLSPSPSPNSRSRASTPPPGQPNDFNRKDLFTQHQRRMHAPWFQSGRRRVPSDSEHAAFEASLEEVRRRCWYELRQAPFQSHCGFCHEVFSGPGSWDVRMEHVGRHFEREDRQELGEELEDVALREWGLREGILTQSDGRCRLASLVGLDM